VFSRIRAGYILTFAMAAINQNYENSHSYTHKRKATKLAAISCSAATAAAVVIKGD
jgi:hypothetical protein